MEHLLEDFPTHLSDEFNSLNLHSQKNVLIDTKVPTEVAELLLEKDRNNVNLILENDSVVDRLGKTCNENEDCLTKKIQALEGIMEAEETSNSYYEEEIKRKNDLANYWSTQMNQTSKMVLDLEESWMGIVDSKLTPDTTRKRLTDLLDGQCCITNENEKTDSEFLAYSKKNPNMNTKGGLSWTAYKEMKDKVDNAVSFDPLYDTTHDEIVASTRLALQKKQNAAIQDEEALVRARKKTINYFKFAKTGYDSMSSAEKISKGATSLSHIMGGVAKFGTVNDDMTDSQKALRIASGVIDIATAAAEFLPPPASVITGRV